MLRLATVLFTVLLLFTSVSYSQEYNTGAVNDSFNRDYRKLPFPRDNNTNIITSDDILRNIPQEQSVDRVFVAKFDFYGNRVFSSVYLSDALINYTDRRLTLAELYEAADVITKLYQSAGYLSSYAYVPPQIVDNDLVIINVIEARVGSVIVYGASDYKKEFIADHLYLLSSGMVLRARELERKLLLLNSYMGLEVKATLKAGVKPGTTDILVYVTDTNPYKFTFSIDDYGSKDTNLYRLNAAAMIGNVITSGDRLALNLSLGLDSIINTIAGTGDGIDPLQLFYVFADYKFPIMTSGFQLGANFMFTNYVATNQELRPIDLNGSSFKFQLYGEYPIVLSYVFSLKAQAALSVLSASDIYGTIGTLTDTIYKAHINVSGDFFPWYYSGGSFHVGFSQGFNQLLGGSNMSQNSTNMNAPGTPSIVTGDISFYQYLSRYFRIDINANGQYTPSTLLASDRFYLGGVYSVRGYSPSYRSGDIGVRFSGEARANFFSERLQIFGFLDGGATWYNMVQTPTAEESALILSVGGGIRGYPYKGFVLSVEYGYPLNPPGGIYTFDASAIYFRVAYEF